MVVVGPLHKIFSFCSPVATFNYNTQHQPSCRTMTGFALPSNRAQTSRAAGSARPSCYVNNSYIRFMPFCLFADYQGSASRVMYLQIFHIFKNVRCEKTTGMVLQTVLGHRACEWCHQPSQTASINHRIIRIIKHPGLNGKHKDHPTPGPVEDSPQNPTWCLRALSKCCLNSVRLGAVSCLVQITNHPSLDPPTSS